jgi:thiamine-monophosphate kinase
VVRCGGPLCVVSTDTVVAGVHFDPAATPPRAIGRKAMARALSDMGAMGTAPAVALLSAVVPRGTAADLLRGLYEGARDLAATYDTAVVGGDTAAGDGPLVLSVCVLGWAEPGAPVLREGAKEGDVLLVTGSLGGSLRGRHLTFTPRVREGVLLRQRFDIHAMIDLSDGLAADLPKLLAGGPGAVVQAAAVPIAPAAEEAALASGRSPLAHALGDGEDYELLLATDAATADRLVAARPVACGIARIGRVEDDSLWLKQPGDRREPLPAGGFEHTW